MDRRIVLLFACCLAILGSGGCLGKPFLRRGEPVPVEGWGADPTPPGPLLRQGPEASSTSHHPGQAPLTTEEVWVNDPAHGGMRPAQMTRWTGRAHTIRSDGKNGPVIPPPISTQGPTAGEELPEQLPKPRKVPAESPGEKTSPFEAAPPAEKKDPARPGSPADPKKEQIPAPTPAPAAGAVQPARGLGNPPGPGQPPPLFDPHQRIRPTAAGSLLNLPPGETPIERAVQLHQALMISKGERLEMASRIRGLEEAIQVREKFLEEAAKRVQDATVEVERTRKELREASEELKQQRVRLQQMEKDVLEALQSIVRLLEKLLGTGPGPASPGRP